MTTSSYSKAAGAVPVRRQLPPSGESRRCAIDALQTSIAINLQNLDKDRFKDQIKQSISELPDAPGLDAAFHILYALDSNSIGSVISANTVFSAVNVEVLKGDSLENWHWLHKNVSHLQCLDIKDTTQGPPEASD